MPQIPAPLPLNSLLRAGGLSVSGSAPGPAQSAIAQPTPSTPQDRLQTTAAGSASASLHLGQPPLIGPGTRVLHIGDSHTVGIYGREMDKMLRATGAQVASYMITLADLPGTLGGWLGPLIQHPQLLMLVMMLVLVVVGTALDLTPTILIFAPVLLPVAVKAGIDPVYFGLMFVLNGAIGLITPPVGTVLNVVAGVGRLSLMQVIRGVNPFLLSYLVVLGLLVLFPQLVTVPVAWLR